tara:strand:- start:3874 stop:4620 length:747 start_codon:yes stop_codon:yes gene_type:complete
MKKIVAGGCSFTYNNEFTWVGNIKEKYNSTVNVGSCAASNDYIARSVIHELDKQDNVALICQWSGIHRQSYYIDNSNPLYNDFKASAGDWPDWAGDYHLPESDAVSNQNFWIKTGGNNITHPGSSSLIHDHFVKPYAKYFYSDEQALVETFENILRVQYYCESKNIKYLMFWWKKELDNYRLGKYSKTLYNKVNLNNWLPNLGDWCVENTDLIQHDLDQGYHPTQSQHQKYAENIIIPAIEKFGLLNE